MSKLDKPKECIEYATAATVIDTAAAAADVKLRYNEDDTSRGYSHEEHSSGLFHSVVRRLKARLAARMKIALSAKVWHLLSIS